jgi:3-hydroxymyristoyl/3-hydroxydecanoyl-(acyl carrier protein) dehydratase
VRIEITTNAAALRGAAELPPMLAVEMLAQAALVALPGPPEAGGDGPRQGLLAGVENVCWHGPLRPGDQLQVSAALLGRLGTLVKARVELRRGTETVVEAELLLALQRTPS